MGKNYGNAIINGKSNKLQVDVEKFVAEAAQKWKSQYSEEISVLKAELIEIKESQTFICSKYDDLKNEYDKILLINKKQEEEITLLQVQARQVTEKEVKGSEKIDALEQYRRHQNLEIIGIPETKGEGTNKLVTEVTKLLNVEVTPDQMSTSYRLPQRRTPQNQLIRLLQ